MFCTNCGSNVDKGTRYCPTCGAMMPQAVEEQPIQIVEPFVEPEETIAKPPMKWFKFLIYFGLFLGALVSLSTAIDFFTGSVYDGNADLVYSAFGDLKTLDMLTAVLSLVMAGVAIYARFRLAGYYKNGPMMLVVTYAGGMVITLVYIIGIYAILPSYILESMDTSSYISAMAMSLAMIAANWKYFKKREYLFVK